MKKELFKELLESVREGAKMLKKSRFPKQLFVAAVGTPKYRYYEAELAPAKLIRATDEAGKVIKEQIIGVYELVGTKTLRVEIE